jgi:hypothetical protein
LITVLEEEECSDMKTLDGECRLVPSSHVSE